MSSRIPTTKTEEVIFSIRVPKEKLAEAIGIVRNYKDPDSRTVRLSCDDGRLVFELGLGKHLIDCDGSFSGIVKIAQKQFQGVVVERFQHVDGEWLEIECYDKSLRFKGHDLKCSFERVVKQVAKPQVVRNTATEPLEASGAKATPATRWAAPAVDGSALETLHAAELRFPVSLIATMARDLQCCSPHESAHVAVARPQAGDFDHLPVKSDTGIIGLFSRKSDYTTETVSEVMTPLNENILMAGDASMLCFLEKADERPFVFLVEHDCISGAVTLSDIQKVAARPPIFLRLTLFEILLTNWIKRNVSLDEDWLAHVSKKARDNIEEEFVKRNRKGEETDRLGVASLKPKVDAALKLGAFKGQPNAQNQLEALRIFRNDIAHASDYGADPVSASAVPKLLRLLRSYLSLLEK